MLFDPILEKYSKGLPLLDLINVEEIKTKTPTLYVPEVKIYDGGVIFINNGDTVFIKESGPVKVRFLIFDKNGRLLTESDTAYTQFHIKKGKYLARLSCPSMNLSGPNLTLDYFVDIDLIRLHPVSDIYSKKKEDPKSNTNVTEIIENYQYRFLSTEVPTEFDEVITNFDMNRDDIIERFFK